MEAPPASRTSSAFCWATWFRGSASLRGGAPAAIRASLRRRRNSWRIWSGEGGPATAGSCAGWRAKSRRTRGAMGIRVGNVAHRLLVPSPMRVTVLVSRRAGAVRKQKVTAESLREMFQKAGTEADVRLLPGEELCDAARQAVKAGT